MNQQQGSGNINVDHGGRIVGSFNQINYHRGGSGGGGGGPDKDGSSSGSPLGVAWVAALAVSFILMLASYCFAKHAASIFTSVEVLLGGAGALLLGVSVRQQSIESALVPGILLLFMAVAMGVLLGNGNEFADTELSDLANALTAKQFWCGIDSVQRHYTLLTAISTVVCFGLGSLLFFIASARALAESMANEEGAFQLDKVFVGLSVAAIAVCAFGIYLSLPSTLAEFQTVKMLDICPVNRR